MFKPSTAHFSLTEGQVQFFKTFGYLHLPGLFAEDADALSAGFDRAMQKHSNEAHEHLHKAHYENTRTILQRFIERDSELLKLLADKRIQGIAKSLAGDDYMYMGGDGNMFTGDTIWHRDDYAAIKRHSYIKIAFYLEDTDANSGCFRVMPGTHHQGQEFSKNFYAASHNHEESMGITPSEMPAQVIPNKPGDVTIFDFFVMHATCNSKFTRRMFNLVVTGQFGKYKREQYIQSLVDGLVAAKQTSETVFGDELWNYPDPEVHRHLAEPYALAQEAFRRAEEIISKSNKPES